LRQKMPQMHWGFAPLQPPNTNPFGLAPPPAAHWRILNCGKE
jgi:hypothetical protein